MHSDINCIGKNRDDDDEFCYSLSHFIPGIPIKGAHKNNDGKKNENADPNQS
jgi:hypothetical protein